MNVAPATEIGLDALSSYKRKGAGKSRNEDRDDEHKLQKRPQWQGRRRPPPNRQTFASRAYVRWEKRDQQHRQTQRGDRRNRRDQ
jgi:hypothetical protein